MHVHVFSLKMSMWRRNSRALCWKGIESLRSPVCLWVQPALAGNSGGLTSSILEHKPWSLLPRIQQEDCARAMNWVSWPHSQRSATSLTFAESQLPTRMQTHAEVRVSQACSSLTAAPKTVSSSGPESLSWILYLSPWEELIARHNLQPLDFI